MSVFDSPIQRTMKSYEVQQDFTERLKEIKELRSKNEITSEDAEKAEKRLQKKTWNLNFWLLFGILCIGTMLFAVVRSLFTDLGLAWLGVIRDIPEDTGNIGTVLGPLLAVSVSIERVLETVFSWYEQSYRSVSDVLDPQKETPDWISLEYQKAFKSTQRAAESLGVEATEDSLNALDDAEQRLERAKERLFGWVDAPDYLAWKQALCILIGLMVGILISILGDLGMLHLIGIPIPRILDMFITGLVIGAGPGPMHALIGVLQSGKDVLTNLANLAKGRAAGEATKKQPA